jgi:TIR domain
MPYVPGCRYDLFISYARENNREGWVDQFQKALSDELGELLGRQFSPKDSIYFDTSKLEVAHSFPVELAAAARDSAILVPILSPSYLTSNWCNRERTAFFSKLTDGAQPPDCLAPILLRPIDESGLDALYRNAQRISFLSADGQTPLPAGSPEWTGLLRKLAGQLKNALQTLRRKCKPVFLGKAAETDRLQRLRAWCRTEIERNHFRTIPDALPALDDPNAVQACLQEAGLAIHYLGGADESAIATIETSIEVCAGPTIIYQPFGVDLAPDEKIWLGPFENQLPAAPGRYQRLAGKNDQELMALVNEQIVHSRPEATGLASVELALICDEPDLESVRRLKEAIRSRRPAEVGLPDFLGNRLKSMERLRKWNEYLARSQALLFYHGAAERSRLELIWEKAQQDRPEVRKDWFLAEPGLDDKRKQYPDALSSVDQIVQFLDQAKTRSASG